MASDRFVRGVAGAPPRVAFLFSGQGSQFPGMGRELYDSEPVVADILERCDAAFGGGLLDVIYGDNADRLNQTGHTQPALFALEVALAALGARGGSSRRRCWATASANTPPPAPPGCSRWRTAWP